ncbi:unnamed protein product [Linum trigynum]|uniref:Uncharacterized protein n=1 Tax=Linum trigynum TaxID=586398 RepID=A0AAV2C7T3_9ROSI
MRRADSCSGSAAVVVREKGSEDVKMGVKNNRALAVASGFWQGRFRSAGWRSKGKDGRYRRRMKNRMVSL